MTRLGQIKGRSIYGEFDHRGWGTVGLSEWDGTSTPAWLVWSIVCGVMAIAATVVWLVPEQQPWARWWLAGSVAAGVLPWLVGGLFARSMLPETQWFVGPRRGLFHITLPHAFLRIVKHIEREDARRAVQEERNAEVQRLVTAVQEAMEDLP